MFKNYIKIAFRNLYKGKLFSIINIVGLSVGLACAIFILIYIQKELSYDRFHTNKEDIYRVSVQFKSGDGWSNIAWASNPLKLVLEENIPEIKASTQVSIDSKKNIVSTNLSNYYEDNFAHSSSSFFEIFSFPIVEGNPSTLDEPFNVFLSSKIASKYFPNEQAIGKIITLDNKWDYTVSGIFEDFPDNSHIQLDFIGSQESLVASGKVQPENWLRGGSFTYVQLFKNVDYNSFLNKLDKVRDNYLIAPYRTTKDNPSIKIASIPLTSIHLFGNFVSEQIPQGDIKYVLIFSAIALLVLFIACINFINLAIARANSRYMEIGIRKTSGASRNQLVQQHFGESSLTVFVSICLSLVLVELFLPTLNQLMARSLDINWTEPFLIILIFSIWLIVSIGSGIYPALLLSGLKPIDALKSNVKPDSKIGLRKALITFQLAITIALTVCTLVIQKQMNFIKANQPGFKKAQVLMIPNTGGLDDKTQLLESNFKSISGVESVSTSSFGAGRSGGISFIDPKDVEDFESENNVVINVAWGGLDFINTFGLTLASGRSFDENYSTDLEQSILINKSAAVFFGWKDSIGKTINYFGNIKTVVGVVDDFHIFTLKDEIKPLLIIPTELSQEFMAVRINDNSIQNSVSEIEEIWTSVLPEIPFSYQFLDDSFDAMYRTELRLSTLLTIFAMLAIIIASLGLVGISSYLAKLRTKEIGIRKVLGASASNLILMLSSEFVKLVFIGFSLAAPLSWYVMNKWLQNFAYSTELGIGIFLLSGLTTLILLFLTVGSRAYKAASVDPVKSLQND